MMRWILAALSSLPLLTMPLYAMTVKPLGRQAIYLTPTTDALVGNLMLRVTNPLAEPVDDTVPLMLPLQTQQWEPLAGLSRDDIHATPSGEGWAITRRFDSGMKSLAVEFRVQALFGRAQLTIPILYHVDQLSLFAKPALLTFDAYPSYCHMEPNSEFMGMHFDILSCSSPPVGQDLSLVLSGVPEGRLRYLLLAGIFGFLLFVSGFVIALVGRPRLDGGI